MVLHKVKLTFCCNLVDIDKKKDIEKYPVFDILITYCNILINFYIWNHHHLSHHQ